MFLYNFAAFSHTAASPFVNWIDLDSDFLWLVNLLQKHINTLVF